MNEMSQSSQGGLADIDLTDLDTLACPYDAYKTLRAEAPVYLMPQTGAYVVSRYDLVMEAVRNTEIFSSQVGQADATSTGGVTAYPEVKELFEREGHHFANTMISADPPVHTKYRALVDRAFTASRVRGMQDYIEATVNELIDAFIDRGEVELVEEFAIKLPTYIIADQLGVPRKDADKFKAWSDAAVPIGLDLGREHELERARLVIEFQKYFAAVVEAARIAPRDDIISALVTAQIEDLDGSNGGKERPLDMAETLSIIQQMLVAGNETTTNAIGSGLLLLLDNPDQLRALREGDDATIKTFVEEVVRLEAPVRGLFRVTTCDTELGGYKIPAGSPVMLRWAAANRDENVFENGDELDVCRRNAGAQIGFGVGVHFCVGAMLARAEMFWAFKTLLARMDNIRLANPDQKLAYHPNFILKGLVDLPLKFDKVEVAAAAAAE